MSWVPLAEVISTGENAVPPAERVTPIHVASENRGITLGPYFHAPFEGMIRVDITHVFLQLVEVARTIRRSSLPPN